MLAGLSCHTNTAGPVRSVYYTPVSALLAGEQGGRAEQSTAEQSRAEHTRATSPLLLDAAATHGRGGGGADLTVLRWSGGSGGSPGQPNPTGRTQAGRGGAGRGGAKGRFRHTSHRLIHQFREKLRWIRVARGADAFINNSAAPPAPAAPAPAAPAPPPAAPAHIRSGQDRSGPGHGG